MVAEFEDLKPEPETGEEEFGGDHIEPEDVEADVVTEEEAPEPDPEPEPVKEEEPKKKKKRVYTYLAKYTGTAKNIRLSGIGRIYIGKEFEVSENVANALRLDENFEVRKSYTYVEV